MKKFFKLITVASATSVSLISADQYYLTPENGQSYYPSCNNPRRYYQDQPNNTYYYPQREESNQRQGPQGYYERDGRNYQQNNPYEYQQQPQGPQGNYERSDRNYQQNNPYGYQQRQTNQYDQYQQQQSNRAYDKTQPINYENNEQPQKNSNQRTISDQEINKKIRDMLSSGWFSKGFQNVSFDINNGYVNLRGSVDTLENKNKVEDNLRKIDGVRQINNQITITKESPDAYSDSQLQNSENKYPQDVASTSQDRQLNAKIRDKLSNGWISKGYETLTIKTVNSSVTISGTVDKMEDIQKIIDQIKDIEGVKSINNQINVKNT